MCAVFVHSVLHSLHGGVDVLSLRLEEAQHLFALRNLRRESHQRLQRERDSEHLSEDLQFHPQTLPEQLENKFEFKSKLFIILEQTLIPPFSALNGTINYKTHIMLYSARLENSARANKLIRIMSRVRIIGIQSQRPCWSVETLQV